MEHQHQQLISYKNWSKTCKHTLAANLNPTWSASDSSSRLYGNSSINCNLNKSNSECSFAKHVSINKALFAFHFYTVRRILFFFQWKVSNVRLSSQCSCFIHHQRHRIHIKCVTWWDLRSPSYATIFGTVLEILSIQELGHSKIAPKTVTLDLTNLTKPCTCEMRREMWNGLWR